MGHIAARVAAAAGGSHRCRLARAAGRGAQHRESADAGGGLGVGASRRSGGSYRRQAGAGFVCASIDEDTGLLPAVASLHDYGLVSGLPL